MKGIGMQSLGISQASMQIGMRRVHVFIRQAMIFEIFQVHS